MKTIYYAHFKKCLRKMEQSPHNVSNSAPYHCMHHIKTTTI